MEVPQIDLSRFAQELETINSIVHHMENLLPVCKSKHSLLANNKCILTGILEKFSQPSWITLPEIFKKISDKLKSTQMRSLKLLSEWEEEERVAAPTPEAEPGLGHVHGVASTSDNEVIQNLQQQKDQDQVHSTPKVGNRHEFRKLETLIEERFQEQARMIFRN